MPGAVLGLGLTSIAFLTHSGVLVTHLGANTWVEIALTVAGALTGVTLLLAGASARGWALRSLVLFCALALLTAISIAWSVAPDTSWVEAGQTVSYLAAFGGALAAARLAPARWRALVGAIAVAAGALCAWSLVVKVFPASLDSGDLYGRLSAPFGYWNAIGLTAAIGLPACLWAGSRREAGAFPRALAVPGTTLLLSALALSYSRSALLAAFVGLAVWFAVVPTRLRGAAVLALGAAGAAVISGWALETTSFNSDYTPLSTRVSDGHTFAVVLVVVLVAVTAGGYLAITGIDRAVLSPERRRQLGTALIALVALAPIVGIGALAASSRGLTGQVSHAWSSLTSTTAPGSDKPGRVLSLDNARTIYWREAATVGAHAPAAGVGAGGFQYAQTRYTNDTQYVGQAHSYVMQTFADLGAIGLALSAALLAAWCAAAGVTLRRRAQARKDRDAAASTDRDAAASTDRDAAASEDAREHAGLVTMLCVVLAFGTSSAIDWTWFIPGVALPALLCAGWLAGRGSGDAADSSARAVRRISLARKLGATALAAVGVVIAWGIWQPLHSVNEASAALTAAANGNGTAAIADAQAAASSDPVAARPLLELAAFYGALGDQRRARAEYLDAVSVQPDNYEVWRELGMFDFQHHELASALSALERAHALNLADQTTLANLQTVRSARG